MVGCDVIEVVKIEELKEALVFECTHLSGVMLLYLCDYQYLINQDIIEFSLIKLKRSVYDNHISSS